MDKNNNNDININARLEREYKGYNMFDHVVNKRIQAWNRLSTLINIRSHKGKQTAINYLNFLEGAGRLAVTNMIEEMKRKGYTKLHKEVWDTNV